MNEITKKPFEIFLRQGSANYYMRFSLKGHGQIVKALGTRDREVALGSAEIAYQKAVWEAEAKILPGKTSFIKVATGFLKSLEPNAATPQGQKNTYAAHKGVIDRYLSPFFGKRTMAAINEPQLDDYIAWRRSYWTTGPGRDQRISYQRDGRTFSRPAIHKEPTSSTLRREAVTLNAVFSYAVRTGVLVSQGIPKIQLGNKQALNKRPSFTPSEIVRLLSIAERRIGTAPNQRVQYERSVLWCFIGIAVETGMRPTEMYNLEWGHITNYVSEKDKPIGIRKIRIGAYGKGLAPQELVPTRRAVGKFDVLWDAFVWLQDREPQPNDPVFCNLNKEAMKSIKSGLNALLETARLKEDSFGRKRTAYSFRHTYASNQLRKGTNIYSLSINMRTSVKMIEKYYSDVQSTDFEEQLEGSFD